MASFNMFFLLALMTIASVSAEGKQEADLQESESKLISYGGGYLRGYGEGHAYRPYRYGGYPASYGFRRYKRDAGYASYGYGSTYIKSPYLLTRLSYGLDYGYAPRYLSYTPNYAYASYPVSNGGYSRFKREASYGASYRSYTPRYNGYSYSRASYGRYYPSYGYLY